MKAHRVAALVVAAAVLAAMGGSGAGQVQQIRVAVGTQQSVIIVSEGGAMAVSVTATTATATTSASAPATVPATMAGQRRVHVFVSGRVQGVSYRAFTRQNAIDLKVRGWVMNLSDGRVEAMLEGPADKVGELLQKMRRGPQAAAVEQVKATDEKPTGEFHDFEIRVTPG